LIDIGSAVPATLDWQTHDDFGLTRIEAADGGREWTISPRHHDVARIHFVGKDADGTIVCSTMSAAFAETAEEAMIVVDVLRAGTDHLPDWQEQLGRAGFVRSYPDAPSTDGLSEIWHDVRATGTYQLDVRTGAVERGGTRNVSVFATYHADGSNSWHNVCHVAGQNRKPFETDHVRMRGGLPEGVDPIKAGVAASIAIRDARRLRGGRFSKPLGGPTKAPKAPKAPRRHLASPQDTSPEARVR